MAINVNNIKIFQAQDNTDNDSGGGSRTSTEIVDGDVNNLFPDISRIDTVSGDVALRKIFPTVFTLNRDIYYGAHSIIRKKPTDPKVSALLFHSDDAHDKRINAQNDIESYVVASYIEQFYLFGNHVAGSKAVTFLQTLSQAPPTIGEVYLLIDPSTVEQYVRIVDMDIAEIVLQYNAGSGYIDYTRRRIICEIEQGLEIDFTGSQFNPAGQEDNTTTTYATQIADAAKFYGTRPLAEDVLTNDTTIKVDTIYEALVPASKAQTPLVNQDAISKDFSIAPTGRVVSFLQSFTNGGKLGVPVVPGTLTLSASYSDDSLGNIIDSGSNVVASINYATGVITGEFTTGALLCSFEAGLGDESTAQFTSSIFVDNTNQGVVFVKQLSPLPSLGHIHIDYRSNGKWYRISGNYDGTVGGDPSIGAGNVNDNADGTGTLSLTLGSLPDIDSTIIITWGSVGIFTDRYEGVNTGYELVVHKSFGHLNIDPISFIMVMKDAQNTDGTITCDADGVLSDTLGVITGRLDLASGELYIVNHSLNNRFQDASSVNLISVDYNYAEPGLAAPGEQKSVTISEASFTTFNRVTNDYTFNIGESVVRETVLIEFYIVYSEATYVDTYYQPMRKVKIELVYKPLRGLVERSKYWWAFPPIWGDVALNGDVALDLQGKSMAKPNILDYLTTNLPRYVQEVLLAKPSPVFSVFVNYRAEAPLSYPNSVSLSETYAELFDMLIKLPEYLNSEIAFSAKDLNNTYGEVNNYYSKNGVLYNRGSDLQVGTVDYDSGLVQFEYSYPDEFYLNVYSVATGELAEEEEQVLVYDFKTASTRIVPSSFQMRYYTVNQPGVLQTATSDANGVITGDSINSALSYVDTETGMVHIVFTNNSFPESIKYDAVAETTLPIDPDLLGLNPIRLPIDGRVPIFENGRHLVIFDEATTATTNPTPLANDVQTLARSGQSYIEVIDDDGKRLDPVQYVADRILGTVTFTSPLVLEDKYGVALTAPFYIVDRIEDMLLAVDVQITGDMTLSAALSHNYTAANSFVASALVWGDVGARVFNYFAQEIWNSGNPVWQDTLDGDPTTAQYDDVNYPIDIDNQSSTSGRWAIIFTSATTVQVAHEKLGIVAANFSISIEDVAPINPATGAPYFIMNRNGFGSGWVTNNVIRINTDSGDANMWVIRTVQSGALSELTDNVEIEIRGDAN